MKVIKRGEIPLAKKYQATCMNCGTIFEFMKCEAEYVVDQRDGDCLRIKCPLHECKHTCYVGV